MCVLCDTETPDTCHACGQPHDGHVAIITLQHPDIGDSDPMRLCSLCTAGVVNDMVRCVELREQRRAAIIAQIAAQN